MDKFKQQTGREKAFSTINVLLMILVILITLIPFLHVVSKAVSSGGAVSAGQVTLFPVDFQLDTVKHVLSEGQFQSSLKVSIFITLVGTLLAMCITTITAYALSKPFLKGRKGLLFLFIFVMLFQGGMIPNYLLYKSIGLVNTVWALVVSGMFSVYNMLIMKSYFEGLPETIEEAARVDGASNMTVLFRIVLPMATPVLATVALFYAVSYWNNYLNAVLYITKPALKPLQQYLYDLVTAATNVLEGGTIDADLAMNLSSEGMRSAAILVSTLPILCAYPFLQKYFQKGITMGAVKG